MLAHNLSNYLSVFVCVCVHVCVSAYMYVCVRTCMCVCVSGHETMREAEEGSRGESNRTWKSWGLRGRMQRGGVQRT